MGTEQAVFASAHGPGSGHKKHVEHLVSMVGSVVFHSQSSPPGEHNNSRYHKGNTR